MKRRLLQVVLIGLLFEGQGLAQVGYARCCISESDLARIGLCLSGPGDTDIPVACGSIGSCVLGFAEAGVLSGQMCDPEEPAMPDDPNALCASWAAQAASVTHECVASPNTDFNLFETYDADQDGDLDLWDMAVFQQTYQSLPKQFESLTQVVSVKCCISESNLTRIGECLSGPDDTRIPRTCGSVGTCVLGFGESGASTGDMCDPAQPDIPDHPRAVCMSWVAQEAIVAQECVASPSTDFNLFETFDADQDGDLDLRDMAAFQRTYQSVPKEVQSDARLVFVECCVPAAGMGIGQKQVSGAEVAKDAAVSQPVCTLGFSGIIEPGDYLYKLCRSGTTPDPPDGSTCVSWSAEDVAVAFLCEGVGVCEYRCPTGDDGGSDPGGCFADFAGLEGPSEAPSPE